MSDLPLPTVLPIARSYWRPVLAASVLGAAALALSTQAGPHDPELAVLLRFMAVVKAAMALGAAALVGWRFGSPVRRPAVSWGYVAGTSSMAAGAGLIWQLGHVGTGALLVHGGLLALAGLAWVDRAGWVQAVSAVSMSRRSKRSAWPGAAIRTPPRGTSRQRLRSSSIGSDTSSSPAGPSR